MKQGWEIKKLGDIAESRIGLTYKPENVSETGTIVLRSGNIQNSALSFDDIVRVQCNIKESLFVQENDILMCSRNGSANLVGKVALIKDIKEPMSYGAFMTIIRSKYQNYLFAFFKSPAFRQQLTSAKTATINQITVKMLNDIEIPVPPLTEQEHIVAELDLLSGIIEKQKQQLKEYDTLAQSIFYDMFGDPITNEKGWEVDCIGNIADFYNGAAHEGLISQKGYCVVNSKFISTNGLVRKYCEQQILPLLKNDIVMVMSDVPNGKALAKCYLIEADNKYTLNQRICAFRNYKLNPLYFFYYLNRHPYYLRFDDGNAQTNLRRNDVLKCPVSIPPLTLQQEFAKKIEAIEKQKELIKQSFAETETLFNSRMEYYFN